MATTLGRIVFLGLMLGVFAALQGCEKPPTDSSQRGYRGTGMLQVTNPSTVEAKAASNALPQIAPPARVRANAPLAGAVYQNVQVLGNVSVAEFARTMDAITAWVSPAASCAYCHVEGNFASDDKYTKVVARRMLQMVRHVNDDWSTHVAATGVTCYTCHRGQPLPTEVWFKPAPQDPDPGFIGNRNGQNMPARQAGLAALPAEVFERFLAAEPTDTSVRVASGTALPTTSSAPVQSAEATYALMFHLSGALGVNCTYCHNSRAFASWEESTPQRVTAWHGLRMARDLNSNYLSPLSGTFPEIPAGRLGPLKDAAKVNCATCHQGAFKPLLGAQMARHYPALAPKLAAAYDAGQTVAAAPAGAQPAPK